MGSRGKNLVKTINFHRKIRELCEYFSLPIQNSTHKLSRLGCLQQGIDQFRRSLNIGYLIILQFFFQLRFEFVD